MNFNYSHELRYAKIYKTKSRAVNKAANDDMGENS